MAWKDLERERKTFVIIGIPCFIFVFYLLFNFYLLFSATYLVIFITATAALLKRKKIYFNATKIAVIMVIVFLISNFNIFAIPGQIARHSLGGRQSLLEPNHSGIKALNISFYEWHYDNYNISFNSLNETTWDELELKMKRVDRYILYNKTEWTEDRITYFNPDYIATLDEIFASDSNGDGVLEDDCDGITVLTVSLLLYMGYDAYVAECMSHWNTIVFPVGADPTTLEGFEAGIHLYNSWGRPSYYIFNQERVIFPPGRPIIGSMLEIIFDAGMYEDFAYMYMGGIDLPLYLLIIITFVVLLLISIVLYLIVKMGMPRSNLDKKSKRKRFLRTVLNGSIAGSLIAFIIVWFVVSGLGSLCSFLLYGVIIFIARYDEFRIKKD
jgi:hypothetical protein